MIQELKGNHSRLVSRETSLKVEEKLPLANFSIDEEEMVIEQSIPSKVFYFSKTLLCE